MDERRRTRDVGPATVLGVLVEQHPAHVRVQQPLADAVRVPVGVGVSVVAAVAAAPPADGALGGATADSGEEEPQRQCSGVGAVGPEAVVSGGDAEAGPEVVDEGPEDGLAPQGCVERRDHAGKGQADDEDGIDPVDVPVPICEGHRLLADVRHLGRRRADDAAELWLRVSLVDFGSDFDPTCRGGGDW